MKIGIYRVSIVGPRGPLHGTILDVEREVFYGDITGRLVDAVAHPGNLSVGTYDHICVDCSQIVLRVGTGMITWR